MPFHGITEYLRMKLPPVVWSSTQGWDAQLTAATEDARRRSDRSMPYK